MILFIAGLVAGAAMGVLIMGALTAGRLNDMEHRLDLLSPVTFVRSPPEKPMNLHAWWIDDDDDRFTDWEWN